MTIQNIVDGINAKLAGEMLTFNQVRLFLNECVDEMNTELNACYPDFDELHAGDSYDYIPNKYIRSVLITGTAYKFYETDEEGIATANQYMTDYKTNLFLMKRDFSEQVPLEYRAMQTGYVEGPDLNNDVQLGWQVWW